MRRIYALLLALALVTMPGFAGEGVLQAPARQPSGPCVESPPPANPEAVNRLMHTPEVSAPGFSELPGAHRAAYGAEGFQPLGARYRDFDCPDDLPACSL